MSVISFDLMVQRHGGAHTERRGSVLEIANRKYTLKYRVVVTSIYDGPFTIMNSPLCPRLASSYQMGTETDPIATCVELDCSPTEWPLVWIVTANYDSGRLVDKTFSHPLNQPPEINWGSNDFMRPLVRDGVGTPVVNSAGTPFDPPLDYNDPRPVVYISRNEATFSTVTAQLYRDAVNADIFGNTDPGFAKMKQITATKVYDFGFTYYKVVYEIHYKTDSFAYFVLDSGFRAIDRSQFRDPFTNQVLSNPVTMNGSGWERILPPYGALFAGTLNDNYAVNDDFMNVLISPISGPKKDQPSWPPLAVSGGSAFTQTNKTIAPPHWRFQARVNAEVFDVARVVKGGAPGGADRWTVYAGYAGTAKTGHALGQPVYLEPYFLRFLPNKSAPFAPLKLPVVM